MFTPGHAEQTTLQSRIEVGSVVYSSADAFISSLLLDTDDPAIIAITMRGIFFRGQELFLDYNI